MSIWDKVVDSIRRFLFKPEALSSGPKPAQQNRQARRPVVYHSARNVGNGSPFVRPWEAAANGSRSYDTTQAWSVVKGRKGK